ncbi:hypothetical protein ERO13_A13G202700v2 [Gossypium hirsutum]|nr:hypothetical protein ERO13_A13G202700v2 [Gossypium hirsutum]
MEYWKLVWVFVLAFLFGGYQSEGCWEIEKAALLQLKPFFPLINDEGISWGKGNCCRWNGVECSTSTGRVTRLFLEYSSVQVYNNISQGWYLNISLFLPFHELKSLDLGKNYIAGFIDNQGSFMNKLEILDLSHNTLLGNNILFYLVEFTSLKTLLLNTCGLQGSIDISELNSLKNLKELHLSGNQIESLGSLFQSKRELRLAKLEVLDLSFNYFNNSIFSSLAALPHLKSLNLESNLLIQSTYIQGKHALRFERILDLSVFKNLTSLKYLDLFFNNFFGNIYVFKNLISLTFLLELRLWNNSIEIPSSLAPLFNLSKLQNIYADNNMIYNAETEKHSLDTPTFRFRSITLSCSGDGGSFPQSLNHQHDLQYVDLSNINFKGDQFPNWLLENNEKLQKLNLANSSLSGHFQLPSTSRRGLLYLDVSNNSLDGNIPNEIGAKLPSLEQLNMSNNLFSGGIPISIGDMISLEILDLSNNKLSGGIPRHMPMGLLIFDGSNNRLFGDIQSSMENMSHLVTLDLSNNILSGGIPRWVGKMSDLEELVMANNHFEGPIPMEFCKLNRSLQFLDLSANNISGSLPSCFSSSILSHVYLSRNKLKGPITGFFNSSGLVTLDLSNNHLTGSIPNWIGTLFSLSYLLLNNNRFEGGIPIQLCKLNGLSLIDVSNNNLSGTIPPCLMITTLNDSSHAYYGIPYQYGNYRSFSADVPIEVTMKSISYFYKGRVLTYLSGIDLSCNKLTGEIPHHFQYLRDIIVLNFSHNSLIGPIPPALSELYQIESLNLSYNYLSGNIPSQLLGLHFLSSFKSSYEGNPFLCGEPLPKNCSTDGSSSSMPKNATNEGFIDMKVFYASFVRSYIVMSLCIAIVLYINPYWRRAWFYHVEATTMSCYYFVVDHILPKRFR